MKKVGLALAGLSLVLSMAGNGLCAGEGELGAGNVKQQIADLEKKKNEKYAKLNEIRERLAKTDTEVGKAKEELTAAQKAYNDKLNKMLESDEEYQALLAKNKEAASKVADAKKAGDAAAEKAAVEEQKSIQAEIKKSGDEYRKHPDLNKESRTMQTKQNDFNRIMDIKLKEDPEGAAVFKEVTDLQTKIADLYNKNK